MDRLLTEDWFDLRQMGISLGIGLAGALTIIGFLRWRRGAPVFQQGDFLKIVENSWFFVFIFLYLPLRDMAERHGLGDLASFGILLALSMVTMIPLMYLAQRRMKAAQAAAIDNPNAADVATCVPLSSEEKRVGTKVNLGLILFAIVTIGPLVWLAFSGSKGGVSIAGWLLFYCTTILGVLVYGMVGRWPGSITLQSIIEIDATPQEIWDTIRYCETDAHYKQIVRRVEKLNEPGDVYLLHYFNNDNCTECGLPNDPDAPGKTNRVEVREAREPEFYLVRSFSQGTGGAMDKMMDYEDESFMIEALPSGGSRVTNRDTVVRPRVWLAALLKLGDPLGEHMRNLKAHMEGAEGDTVWNTGASRIAAQRKSAKFCGCPPQDCTSPIPA
jgi:hypothetical protein